MFLNFIKKILLKRKLKNSIVRQSVDYKSGKIKTVGLLIDERFFLNKLELIKELIKNDLSLSDIKILIYKEKIKNNDLNKEPFISVKNINWKGEIISRDVDEFISHPYDLLINYFDENDPILSFISTSTKASFRVGFHSTNKVLNDFMIDAPIERFDIFAQEMFKYLKILNKI